MTGGRCRRSRVPRRRARPPGRPPSRLTAGGRGRTRPVPPGAQRATLLVAEEEGRVLRLVAARGIDPGELDPRDAEAIELDDACSVAARVFREGRIIAYDPTDPAAENPGCAEGRRYKGKAFLSVPVLYAAPGQPSRPIGVINLTDRLGEDAFTAGGRQPAAANAHQIRAAVENAPPPAGGLD